MLLAEAGGLIQSGHDLDGFTHLLRLKFSDVCHVARLNELIVEPGPDLDCDQSISPVPRCVLKLGD